ncbi:MAG TPA: endonuclease V [Phycisphaerae bacterium]|nr:endonuclease V [Phycisphaerae bacterium]
MAIMKLPPPLHRWNLTPRQAIRLQGRLAQRVRQTPLRGPVRFVAGGDGAFVDGGRAIVAAWVVWDVVDQCVVEERWARRPVRFPYVPGLLTFREAPALLAAARKLQRIPDVFLLDGQGRAHPRRIGLASHVGLCLGRPTIGCAKSRLCGEDCAPPAAAGSSAPLMLDGEEVGRVLRTQTGVRPVYVSVGHRVTLADAVRVTLRCCTTYRVPEPTRLADQLVGRLKREWTGRAGERA